MLPYHLCPERSESFSSSNNSTTRGSSRLMCVSSEQAASSVQWHSGGGVGLEGPCRKERAAGGAQGCCCQGCCTAWLLATGPGNMGWQDPV